MIEKAGAMAGVLAFPVPVPGFVWEHEKLDAESPGVSLQKPGIGNGSGSGSGRSGREPQLFAFVSSHCVGDPSVTG